MPATISMPPRTRALYTPTAQLKVAVTGRCTNDCPICFNDTRRRDNHRRRDLPFALLKELVREGARLGMAGVYWTGGEPLLRYQEPACSACPA